MIATTILAGAALIVALVALSKAHRAEQRAAHAHSKADEALLGDKRWPGTIGLRTRMDDLANALGFRWEYRTKEGWERLL